MRHIFSIASSVGLIGTFLSLGLSGAIAATPPQASSDGLAVISATQPAPAAAASNQNSSYEPPVNGGPSNTQGSGTR